MGQVRTIFVVSWLFLSLFMLSPSAFGHADAEPENNDNEITDNFYDATADTSSVDENFLMAAAQMNASEIALSRVAEKETDRARIDNYALRIIRDHSKASRQLNKLAKSLDVQVTNKPDPLHIVATQNLLSLSGRALDRAYVSQMVLDHEEAIRLFETEVRIGSNAEVQDFAKSQLPILREHLRRAQRLILVF